VQIAGAQLSSEAPIKAIADAKRSGEILIHGIDGQKAALDQIMKGTNYVATGLNSAESQPRWGSPG
jgi:ABC-type sugar transport system substrate-binding protein